MNSDHPDIHSVREITISDLMETIEEWDGDLLAAYHVDDKDDCSDEILLIDCDPYLDNDDWYFEYKGQNYVWDVDLYSLRRVKKNFQYQEVDSSVATLSDAAKYYFLWRAYNVWDDSIA